MERDRKTRLGDLKQALETRAFVRETESTPIEPLRDPRDAGRNWLFDIRAIALSAPILDDISHLFWDTFRDRAIQIGGLETAAIPLITALVTSGARDFGRTDASGFYLRKSRKKEGLMRMIEGELRPDIPIVLVDDLMNRGYSLQRQVEVLESSGHRVTDVWTLVRFRDKDAYAYFTDKGIALHTLFELEDFRALGVRNLTQRDFPIAPDRFWTHWRFASPKPSYHLVVPKSDPAIDDQRLYVGSDTGTLWALDQETGQVAWKYDIGHHPRGKGIFSSPAVHDGTVYFGGYDGNVYALDAASGKKRWMSLEADWVGSSPAIAPDMGLLFIGLEYGLWRKRGGMAALDLRSGMTKWRFAEMPCYTHSTPYYISGHRQVVIGSNDGCVYCFDAATGALAWKAATGPITSEELSAGFSAHDIKESVAYDPVRDLVIVANLQGSVHFIERASGAVRATVEAESGFFSTPLVQGDRVFVASLDKHLYCIDLDSFKVKWRWLAGARIFASPIVIGDSLYIGANTGRLTELDPASATERSFLQLTERITNRPAYNARTRRIFVPTFANEIYCVEKIS